MAIRQAIGVNFGKHTKHINKKATAERSDAYCYCWWHIAVA